MVEVNLPRFNLTLSADALDKTISSAFLRLGYRRPTDDQRSVITEFVKGRDVFVGLPTGSGKSLCFAALPVVFDECRNLLNRLQQGRSIVIVVSPLSALMQDQVIGFQRRGLKCTYIGQDSSSKAGVVNGDYQLVYLSPESLLQDTEIRDMLRCKMYIDNLAALVVDEAHCIDTWGPSFRTEFSNIGEARSIISKDVNVMALTATASSSTQKVIQTSLCMHNCYSLVKVPNKHNIQYLVRRKPDRLLDAFTTIIRKIQKKGREADKHIIFCRTYDDTVKVHECIADELGCSGVLFIDGQVTCELFTSSSHSDDKKQILLNFTDPNSVLRIVVATVAFGMGIDAPNVRCVIHWGPPKTVEAYVQESGRCGRDGVDSTALLYYTPTDFTGYHPPSKIIQEYCKNDQKCRRGLLMDALNASDSFTKPTPIHRCCDICSCKCDDCLDLLAINTFEQLNTEQLVQPAPLIHQQLQEALCAFRLSLLDVSSPPLFGVAMATGITDQLITDIATNTSRYDSIERLLSRGVSSEYVEGLMDIITSVQ